MTVAIIVVALITLVTLLWVLRAGQLREKYAVLWVLVGITIVVVGLWPGLLSLVAGWLGVQVPSNLLFFLSILLLLGVNLHLSLAVSRLDDQARTLAEEVAMLHLRLDTLAGRPHQENDPADTADPEGT